MRQPRVAWRRSQRGAAPFAEGYFLLLFWAIGLGILFVFGLCLWLGKGLRGKVIGFVVACAITSPILVPIYKSSARASASDRLKQEATAACQQEAREFPGPFLVDGLLDETGGLSGDDVVTLLRERRFPFVEIRLPVSDRFKANNHSRLVFLQSQDFLRIALAPADSPECFIPASYPEHFFSRALPFLPSSCVQISPVAQSTASHVLKLEPSDKGDQYVRVVLREQASGKLLAAFTDAGPGQWQANGPFTPHADFRSLEECRPNDTSGLATLMWKIEPTPAAADEWARHVLKQGTWSVSDMPPTYAELIAWARARPGSALRTRDGPFAGDDAAWRHRASWPEVFAAAEARNAPLVVYGQHLIDRPAGTAYRIAWPKDERGWERQPVGKYFALDDRVYFFFPTERDGVAVAVFDRQGRAVGATTLADLSPWREGVELRFRPDKLELSPEGDLLIHGPYEFWERGAQGPTMRHWTVTVPLDELRRIGPAKR